MLNAAELHSFDIRGERFLYEANTLAVMGPLPDAASEEMIRAEPMTVSRRTFNGPGYDSEVKFKTVTLITTTACNLGCTYCFVNDRVVGPAPLSMDIATATDFLTRYTLPTATVCFFGGEPTLTMPFVSELHAWLVKRGKPPSCSMTTNGTMLRKMHEDLPICQWLADRGFGLIVSLDGPKEAHDEHRRTRSGESCFTEIMLGLAELKRVGGGKRTTLRGTFTADVLASSVPFVERLSFLNEQMYSGKCSHVSLEPCVLAEGGCQFKDRIGSDSTSEEAFMAAYYKAADWFIAEVRRGYKPSWHQVECFLKRLIQKTPMFSECGAGRGYGTLLPDGTITACHRTEHMKIGTLTDGFNADRRRMFSNNCGTARKGCPECPIRYVCGSGCREASMAEHADVTLPAKTECMFKRILFRTALYIMSRCDASYLIPKANHSGSTPKSS